MFKTKLRIESNPDKALTTDEFIKRQILLARIRKRKQRIKEKEEMEKMRAKKKTLLSDDVEVE